MDTLQMRIAEIHQRISNPRSLLSQNCLFDSFVVLYTDCEKASIKTTSVKQFIEKYKDVMVELKQKNITVSDFDIKRLVQQGNFGDIYLVEEKQTCNAYVMKKVQREKVLNTIERDIMVKSKCANIVSLFYAFQDANHVYYIMEYLTGGDFASLLESQPDGCLSENKASFYIHELVQAVVHLHEMGYVHRDIKPDNMLLSATGHMKLTDFGSATHVDKNGRVKSIVPVGTPEYVAPEVFEWMEGNHGSNGYSNSCDLWSIGVVLYELLTGNTPFNHETLDMTYSSIIACEEENIRFPSHLTLSSQIRSFVQGLIQKVDSRLSMREILSHPLFDCLPTEPPCIPPPSQMSKFHKKDRRKASPSLKGFQNEAKYLDTALPLIGITYTGELNTDATTAHSTEQVRNLKREQMSLLRQLTEYRTTVEALKQEAKEVKRADDVIVDKCKRAMEKNQKQKRSHEDEIARYNLEQDKMRDKVERYEKENSTLTAEMKHLKSLMDAREVKLRKDARRSQQFTEKQSDSRIDELVVAWKGEVKVKDEKIAELKSLLEGETLSKCRAEESRKELEEDLSKRNTMEVEMKRVKAELELSERVELKRVKTELELSERNLTSAHSQIDSLQAQVKALRDDASAQSKLLQEKEKDLERQRQDIAKKDIELAAVGSDVQALRKELQESERKLKEEEVRLANTDDSKLKASEISQELESLRAKLENEKETSKSWKKDWYASVKERNAATGELKLVQTENATLKEKVEHLEKELPKLKEKLAATEKRLQDKERECEGLAGRADSMKKELDSANEQLKEIPSLREKQDKFKKALQELKTVKDQMDVQMRGYKLDLQVARKENEQTIELRASVQKLEREVQGNLEMLAVSEKRMAEAQANIERLTEMCAISEEEVRKIKEDKSEQWHAVKTLEHNLKVAQNSLEDAKRNLSEKESKLKTANEVIAEFESKITALEASVRKSETNCQEMVVYLEKLQENINVLSHDNERLRKERTEYITQMNNTCALNETLTKSNATLSQQHAELESTIKSLETFYKQKEVRLESTVNQLLKLCEHQRNCYEESLRKKPNLLRKMFGSSQNKEFDAKELEVMLNQERSRAKDLAEKLYMTKAELDAQLHRKTQRVSLAPQSMENKENMLPNNKALAVKKTKSQESVGSNTSDGNLKALSRIMNLEKTVDINTAMFLSEQCVVLGTRDGLFSLHLNELGEAKSQPRQIGGVDMVQNITLLHKKQMALIVTGPNRCLQSANLRHLVSAVEYTCSSPSLDTSPLLDIQGVSTLSASPCQDLLAIASGSTLIICRWNQVGYDEMCRKSIDGGSIQTVTVLSPHSVVYATDRDSTGFVTFDPTTCRQRAWLSNKDSVLSSRGTRPLCLVSISHHEHLACFNTGALFVDDHGKATRAEPLYWNYMPVTVVYRKPFLVVFNPSCITIIQISERTLRKSIDSTKSSATQPEDRVIDIRKPKFLGETLCNKNVVLMSHGALQLLNPELVFSAESLTLSDVTSQTGDEELGLSDIEEELKLLETVERHTSL